MALKKTEQSQMEVALKCSNNEFKQKLEERIDQGINIGRAIQEGPNTDAFQDHFRDWSEYNHELLKRSFNNPNNEYAYGYDQAGSSFLGLLGEVPNNPKQTLLNQLDYKSKYLGRLCSRIELIPTVVIEKAEAIGVAKVNRATYNSNEIFIVHGHDESAKLSVARFLERLKLTPIILHEQASGGRTIIEKIENYTNVGFAIVLYTDCDLGGKSPDRLKPRARQNVVFEHGYLIGKIGRNNVCALVKGNVETPGDISGVVYIPMDEYDGWHNKIIGELKAAGYEIDKNLI
jgi:predicted nucleotide-binding protein